MKTAIITGSARGIGRAICEQLAAEGVDNIAVCDLQADWCAETVEAVKALGRNAEGFAMNVADAASVEAAVNAVLARFGQIDICVNNAGITKDGLIMRMGEAEWDAVLDINLKGAFLVTKAVSKAMMKARTGSIVNIASIIGLMGNAGQANYAASKGGLIAFTKSCAREFAGRGIRVNAIAPGFIQSKMTDVLPDDVKAKMLEAIPMKSLGQPSDVAKAVAFLAGDSAAYITGQVLSVNGGMLMP
ncbi:MAG: 3-oxoacyl-[acyl-carrier-protein] reductase [Kiritimatiellae bacterium]|jgi:3-oxoacyl-[acyl-carrier protein] reductase|nr:3-oxoacyl-[acyl-carrier-protein] reductase [Kiritimatiellia bacterium]